MWFRFRRRKWLLLTVPVVPKVLLTLLGLS